MYVCVYIYIYTNVYIYPTKRKRDLLRLKETYKTKRVLTPQRSTHQPTFHSFLSHTHRHPPLPSLTRTPPPPTPPSLTRTSS